MNPNDLLYYLNGADDSALYGQADAVRESVCGRDTFIHAVVPLSNICDRGCRHCDMRGQNKRLPRFRLQASRVLELVTKAAEAGAGTVVLTSGNDLGLSAPLIGELVREIKGRADVAVTLRLGPRDLDEYAYWKECGADRCQVNLETTERFLFKRLDQDGNFTDRLHRLEALRDIGYEIGSGVLAGLPGTTPLDSLRDLLFLKDLELDGIEIAPFTPRPGTPMSGLCPGSVDTAMRMAALLRILCPGACIPAAASLDHLRPGSRVLALKRGCDAVMPSMVPRSAPRFPEDLGTLKQAIVGTGLVPSPAKGPAKEGQHVG